jgi:Xaa-Pro aminopeptidase
MWRLLIPLLFLSCASAQLSIDSAEHQARRRAVMEKIPDGIIVLRAFSGLKRWDESGFHQDASFYYFTGLANLHGAILALDGTKRESWLFVSPRLGSFGADLHGFDAAFLDPGSQAEAELKIDHVVPWDQFSSFVEARHKLNPKLLLYADNAGQTGQMSGDAKTPSGMGPLDNPRLVWSAMLRQKWANMPLHGLGVDMAEGVPKSFQAGNVLCYEPMLSAGSQAFFVEDTFLIVPTGYEILNPSLPYSARDIEIAMAKGRP